MNKTQWANQWCRQISPLRRWAAKKNPSHPNSMCPKFASTLARVPLKSHLSPSGDLLSHREARVQTRRTQQSKPNARFFLFYERLYLRSAIKAEYKINRNDCAQLLPLAPITCARMLQNQNYEFFPPAASSCVPRGEGRNLRPLINNRTPNISDG